MKIARSVLFAIISTSIMMPATSFANGFAAQFRAKLNDRRALEKALEGKRNAALEMVRSEEFRAQREGFERRLQAEKAEIFEGIRSSVDITQDAMREKMERFERALEGRLRDAGANSAAELVLMELTSPRRARFYRDPLGRGEQRLEGENALAEKDAAAVLQFIARAGEITSSSWAEKIMILNMLFVHASESGIGGISMAKGLDTVGHSITLSAADGSFGRRANEDLREGEKTPEDRQISRNNQKELYEAMLETFREAFLGVEKPREELEAEARSEFAEAAGATLDALPAELASVADRPNSHGELQLQIIRKLFYKFRSRSGNENMKWEDYRREQTECIGI